MLDTMLVTGIKKVTEIINPVPNLTIDITD